MPFARPISLLLGLSFFSLSVATPTEGKAAYYARHYEGKPTASGQPYRGAQLTAASWEHFGTVLVVTNTANGRSVTVGVNDRGPAKRLGRLIDLSEAAFFAIATEADYYRGTMNVTVRRVSILPKSNK